MDPLCPKDSDTSLHATLGETEGAYRTPHESEEFHAWALSTPAENSVDFSLFLCETAKFRKMGQLERRQERGRR